VLAAWACLSPTEGRSWSARRREPIKRSLIATVGVYDALMAYDAELAQRVRDRIIAVAGVSEKKMFGGLAFLTSGNMTVGVYGDGLIVRIDPAAMDAVLAEPGVRPFDMGGRPMRGWILVASEELCADDELGHWIDRARRYVATLPPK
jgi:TfoX/Sxy family transcriptional regulator of competence genes